MKKIIVLIFIFSACIGLYAQDLHTLSGYVKDAKNGEGLIGATIYIPELKTGTITNVYGFYSISIPGKKYSVKYSYLGFKDSLINVNLGQNKVLNIEMIEDNLLLNEVTVTGQKASDNVTAREMSVISVNQEAIRKIPALMGETDVLKAIQLLPGVNSAGEGFSGFSVRGGGLDQNLILLDEAIVYNASHLMGFFSVFNNDAVKDLKLYKGDIPAEYGGRLSSLLDIRMKDGNQKRFSGTGGLGTISSRLTLEAPLIKDKCSFIVSGRRSYADLFLLLSNNENIRNNKLYFYDLNLKLNYIIDDKNRIYLSSYNGRDIFAFSDLFEFNWGNHTETIRWNHLFSDKLFSNFSLVYSNYDYLLGAEQGSINFQWRSKLRNAGVKADFTYYLSPKSTLKFGLNSYYNIFEPGNASSKGDSSFFNDVEVPHSFALDHALFISNKHKISDLFTLEYGIRYSLFQNIGPSTIYNIDNKYQVIDSSVYKKGDIFNFYQGFEPRLGANYQFSDRSSIKFSYSRTRQYVQRASNATAESPLDVWFPSSPNVKPQLADQIAFGFFRNVNENKIESSIEVYYKQMYNQIDFKDHAQLMLNPRIEAELRFGDAWSYGSEFFIRKNTGKLTGWISYTLSRAMRRVDEINGGKEYLASYDRTHDVSIVGTYSVSKRIDVSTTWVFASGTPVTFPTGRFVYQGLTAPVYSDRNSYRMPAYHRLDLAVTLKPKVTNNRKIKGEWVFSIYNVYNRKNAWQIRFSQNAENPNLYEAHKVYLFPIIPAITYNFKF